ncbi:MAG: hypothetical protein DCC68_24995 [Planctomycetota bacterium]|nr:MAG: hypothetical protein DCC68_24995 [Planctomycetota bacterium]
MTMPRWISKWICASLASAAIATGAGQTALAIQTESTTGDEPSVAAQAPADSPLPPAAGGMANDPWSDGWIDETCDDCIPMVWSHWTINLDAVIWRRKTPGDLQLAMSNPDVVPNTSSMTFDHEGGPRLALIRRGISGWDVELNYVGIEGFRSELNMPNAVDQRIPGDDPGGLFFSDILQFPQTGMRVRYDSRLHSEEINLRRHLNDTWTALVGVRAVQVFENFEVNSPFAPIYTIDTQNRLYGLQIGGEGKLYYTERFLLSTVLKAGLFDNFSEQTTTDVGGAISDNVPPYLLTASTNQSSFVGEVGLMGTYRLAESVLLRVGYDLMWVSDVALASEQVVVNEFQRFPATTDGAIRGIDAGGSLFYHGVRLGVELTW